MDKETFLRLVVHLKEYNSKFNELCDILDVDIVEGFLGQMLDDFGELLISGVNNHISSKANEDWFYETFWNTICDDNKDNSYWSIFYDRLVTDIPEN